MILIILHTAAIIPVMLCVSTKPTTSKFSILIFHSCGVTYFICCLQGGQRKRLTVMANMGTCEGPVSCSRTLQQGNCLLKTSTSVYVNRIPTAVTNL